MDHRYRIVVNISVIIALLLSFSAAQGVQTTQISQTNLCQNVSCSPTEVCRLVTVQCFQAPCDPVPECVPVTTCSPLTGCDISCSTGMVRDANGCPTCQCVVCDPDPCPGMICFYGKDRDENGCVLCLCNEPCTDIDCPSGTQCQVEKNATTNAFYGKCETIVTRPPCPVVSCTNVCPYSYKSDSNGCRTCECYDPCQGYPCPDGQTCVLSADDCPPGAECRDAPMPYCTDASTVPTSTLAKVNSDLTCQPLTGCTLNCTNGLVQNASGCPTCQCVVCDPDPCPGMMCLYGKERDANGCVLCPCYDPCSGVDCDSGEECQIVRNPTTNSYVGQCVALETRAACAQIHCNNTCRFFFTYDSNGCQTCTCYDPCQNYPCLPNERCMLSADDCPPDGECRDAPMPHCVDMSNSSSLSSTTIPSAPSSTYQTAGRGEPGLFECCIEAGISDGCLPFCTTNITQLFQDYEALTICYRYLGDFLKCASGGRSFESCCRSRGVSESCVYMCSGDDEVDMSNPHQVTQCVSTSAQTVIDCFNGGVPDTNVTATSTLTIPSTTSTSFCSMSPDPGSCNGSNNRWYYSPIARACALFNYGGCDGNGNRFLTKDACLSSCGNPGSTCPEVLCEPSCQITLDEFGCHTCSCGNDCFTQGCPQDQQCMMMPGTCPGNTTNCPLAPRCVSMPDNPCDTLNCTLSCANGWMTDSRGCAICQCQQRPAYCQMAPDYGMSCSANASRWFYNGTTNRCGSFAFGGCLGNDNNFQTMEVCETICKDDDATPVCPPLSCDPLPLCDYGLKTGVDGCMTCQCSDPCDGMVCPSGLVCVSQKCDDSETCPDSYTRQCVETTSTVATTAVTTSRTSSMVCPQVMCLMFCPLGYERDANGCDTCKCRDPCKNCTANQTCVTMSIECPPTTSPACAYSMMGYCVDTTTTTSVSTTQPPVSTTGFRCLLCMMRCMYGMLKDSRGCAVCSCYNPCQNLSCSANNTCVVSDTCQDDEDCTPDVRYQAACAPESTTTTSVSTTQPPVSTTGFRCLLCMMRCMYGMLKDSRGCAVCSCYNPCQNLSCSGNNTCAVSDTCQDDEDCTPDVRYKAACAPAATTHTTASPVVRTTPTPKLCMVCSIYCNYGMEMGSNGCPICKCKDPCSNVTCPAGQECHIFVRTDGQFMGQCAAQSTSTTTTTTTTTAATTTSASTPVQPCPPVCMIYCEYGNVKDSNGCDTCQCFDPCKNVTCPADQVCRRVSAGTDRQFTGQCVAQSTSTMTTTSTTTASTTVHQCPPLCRMYCQYGNVKDSNGCSICQCVDPCKDVSCSSTQRCVPSQQQKCNSTGACQTTYTGVCTDIPSTPGFISSSSSSSSTTSTVAATSTPHSCSGAASGCEYPCPYNYGKDSHGCRTCQCRDPCQTSTTCSSQTCVRIHDNQDCEGSICWPTYKGVCKGNCQEMSNCNINCTYGYDSDSSGCSVCRCRDPCQNITCQSNYECRVKDVNSCNAGVCETISTGYCAASCPSMSSCSISCKSGLAWDVSGCKTCQCLNPCEGGMTCRADETCVVTDPPIGLENPPALIYAGRCVVCQQTGACKMSCPHGFTKDTLGCTICQCYEPCQNVICPEGQMCVAKEQFNGKYDYVPQCTATASATTFPPAVSSTTTFPAPGPSTTTSQCPMPMCLRPRCTYGLATDANGCTTCTCATDPCQDHTCSNSNDICQTLLYCPTNNCQPYPTVCIDKLRPCEALQKEYERLFGDALVPQLNCDSSGQFKVTQCYGQDCFCVNGTGTAATNSSDPSINCYNGNQILMETVKIDADFNMIKPEDGWKFKQQLSQQVANTLTIDENLVTVMKYEKGSIIALVAIASDATTSPESLQGKLTDLRPQTLNFVYVNNDTYPLIFVGSYSTTGLPTTTTTTTTSPAVDLSDETNFNQILMIVLVCVFVPIAFVAIAATIWLGCKTCRNQRMIPSKPLKSDSSTEISSVESGSEKIYPTDKSGDKDEVWATDA